VPFLSGIDTENIYVNFILCELRVQCSCSWWRVLWQLLTASGLKEPLTQTDYTGNMQEDFILRAPDFGISQTL
jgi:hypothetical protein